MPHRPILLFARFIVRLRKADIAYVFERLRTRHLTSRSQGPERMFAPAQATISGAAAQATISDAAAQAELEATREVRTSQISTDGA
jgi:hypothetical protein